MRKLLEFNMVSLDGYFEGPDRDISWHNVDAEFNEYAVAMLDSVDLLLFGRVTYELMVRFWPTPEVIKSDPLVATRMNSLAKIVFSRTLGKAEWHNTRLVKEKIEEEIKKLKQGPGKDMVILGSGSIVSELTPPGLIDEHRIMVNPVILGKGNPLFKGINNKLDLELTHSKAFKSGNVLLYYRQKN
ncbi:MAG: dihydrofolate reductase family protein [Nitrospiraceae bacterium]|nr:dihydrofolate reductase family protein [Nitrospiraceae bacterium]